MINEVSSRRAEIEELCRRYGVWRLDVFGSAAVGDFRPGESDLDFLVEFDSKGERYADRYFGLLEGLKELFEREVDLVEDSAIRNPYFRKSVDESRELLYAA